MYSGLEAGGCRVRPSGMATGRGWAEVFCRGGRGGQCAGTPGAVPGLRALGQETAEAHVVRGVCGVRVAEDLAWLSTRTGLPLGSHPLPWHFCCPRPPADVRPAHACPLPCEGLLPGSQSGLAGTASLAVAWLVQGPPGCALESDRVEKRPSVPQKSTLRSRDGASAC